MRTPSRCVRSGTRLRVPAAIGPHAGHIMAGLWIAATFAASIKPVLGHERNFEIFRTASHRLMGGQELYAASRPGLDLFKYTPSFALLFAPFAILPFALGVVLWNALNAARLYAAVGRLLPPRHATLARATVPCATFGSLPSTQSKAPTAGLMVLPFG